MAVNERCVFNNSKDSINGLKTWKNFIVSLHLFILIYLLFH